MRSQGVGKKPRGKKKEQSGDKQKEQLAPSQSLNDARKEPGDTYKTTHPTEKVMDNFLEHWRTYKPSDKAQIVLTCTTIATFIAISVIGVVQSCQTRHALAYADSSNTFQEAITRIGTRAYLGIEDPQPVPMRGRSFMVSVVIRNVGKSPAKNVYVCGSLVPDISKADSFATSHKGICERHKREDQVLVPGSSYLRIFHFGDSSTTAAVTEITKRASVLVMGRAVYLDVFDKEHFVEFCYFYDTDSKRYLVYDKFNAAN